MSDRIADRVGQVLDLLSEIEPETDKQLGELIDARESLKLIAQIDRDRNGPTPDEKLAAAVEKTDVCLGCGEPIEQGGFCGLECLKEVGDQ